MQSKENEKRSNNINKVRKIWMSQEVVWDKESMKNKCREPWMRAKCIWFFFSHAIRMFSCQRSAQVMCIGCSCWHCDCLQNFFLHAIIIYLLEQCTCTILVIWLSLTYCLLHFSLDWSFFCFIFQQTKRHCQTGRVNLCACACQNLYENCFVIGWDFNEFSMWTVEWCACCQYRRANFWKNTFNYSAFN